MELLLVLSRLLHYSATMVLFGSALTAGYLTAPLPPVPRQHVMSRLLQLHRVAAIVALLTAVLWLMAVAGGIGEGWADALDPTFVGSVLSDTAFGSVWRWRLILFGVLAALTLMGRPSEAIMTLLAAFGLASIALTGHAAMHEGMSAVAHASADAIHLLAGAVWIGGLIPLALALRSPEVGHRVALRFSILASSAVVLVVLTGTANGWLVVESPRDLMTTTYGELLSAKVILVALMIMLALINRFRIAPGFVHDPVRTGHYLRLSIALELALALAVLVLVAVFGTLPPPGHG